jgi:hypothetical protein
VTRRVSLDDETEFAIWKRRSAADATQSRRVLIGHRDKAIGESLVLLLSLKGYDAIYAADQDAKLSEVVEAARGFTRHAPRLRFQL